MNKPTAEPGFPLKLTAHRPLPTDQRFMHSQPLSSLSPVHSAKKISRQFDDFLKMRFQ